MPKDKKSGSEKTRTKNPHDNSSIYIKNEKTGEWEVKNPAGSIAYNYLYRDDFEEESNSDESDLDEKDKKR